MTQVPDRNLALELIRVTETAALAAAPWIGRGDKDGADGAAVKAMRSLINTVDMAGVVVIGEGEKDNAPMLHDGEEVGKRRADFIVENQVIVELKAVINLEDVHLAQAKNYVVAYNFSIGLLINFGATSLQFKKIFNSKLKK